MFLLFRIFFVFKVDRQGSIPEWVWNPNLKEQKPIWFFWIDLTNLRI